MKSYETVSEAINDLAQRGYTTDFNIVTEQDCLLCSKSHLTLSPEEFTIDEVHRFEGMSDPGDEMIVFAVSAKQVPAKGVLVNAYGMYEDNQSSRLVRHLNQHL